MKRSRSQGCFARPLRTLSCNAAWNLHYGPFVFPLGPLLSLTLGFFLDLLSVSGVVLKELSLKQLTFRPCELSKAMELDLLAKLEGEALRKGPCCQRGKK